VAEVVHILSYDVNQWIARSWNEMIKILF
jgi:hypothetical protein